MDELSLFPHSNGNHSSNDNDSEIFDEEENEQPIDEIEPQQPVQNVRGGRRKGVPRRLQLSPDVIKPPIQRLLPLANTKIVVPTVHHEQPMITSDHEDENDIENIYQANEQNYLQLDFLSKHFVDKNNNHEEIEDILEIVDDILADIVTIIVKDVKQQRQKSQKYSTNQYTNGKGYSKAKFTDLTKTMQMNSSQTQQVKHKLSPNSSPSTKRQKTVETNNNNTNAAALQHQQLLWEMTQQLMMSSGMNETENASLLKQQLLGLNQTESKRANPRPSKPQSPNVVSMANPTSPLPFERNNFAPRRRGRPPKYVTDRNLTGLSGLDLDPSSLSASYDQLFAAIENGINPNSSGASAAAFQTALASMLGQQAAALSIPPAPLPTAARNGTPASMVKSSAGQTRHSLPASSKLPQDIGGSGLDMPLLATKKRGPGRPPKSQMLFDPHQILQATQRLNSPTHNNYPPTMVPSSPNSFNLNAAFVEMLQQQQQH